MYTSSLAKELVYAKLPQSRHLVTFDGIAGTYGLTKAELLELIRTDEKLKEAIRLEHARAKELGYKAGHVFRVEGMLAEVAEYIYKKFDGSSVSIGDAIKVYQVFARSAGLDGLSEDTRDRGPVTNIQINIPPLTRKLGGYLAGE
jgi:hypothetical protein